MLIGHHKQQQFLKKSAELGRVPHGVLFCGESKLGKKTLAVEFAKFLNCASKDFSKRPCNVCRSCLDIQKGIHPDFILVEPTGAGREIQIGQIRGLISKLSLRSYSAPFKVAVLDQAHTMTKEAQGSFLKLLEEPKGKNTLLILITEYPESLLPTIVSRVQKLKFFPVKSRKIEDYQFSKNLSEDKIKEISGLALGRPGAAIDLLLNRQNLEKQKQLISDLIKISKLDLAGRFRYAKDLFETKDKSPGPSIEYILDVWTEYLRKVLLSRFLKPTIDQKLIYPFSGYSEAKIKKVISLLQSARFLTTSTNVNSKLALEMFFIEM